MSSNSVSNHTRNKQIGLHYKVVRFRCHSYDSWPNWTPVSPIATTYERIFVTGKHRAVKVEKSVFSLFVHKGLLDMKRDVVFLSSKSFKFQEIEESDFRLDVRKNGRSERLKNSHLNLTCVRV